VATASEQDSEAVGASDQTVEGRPLPWVAGVVLFVIAAGLPLLREVHTKPWQTMWAEDAAIFYPQAVTQGPDVVLRGYSGYAQLVTRLVFAVVAALPVAWATAAAAILASVVTALVAAFVFRCTQGWMTSWAMRLAVPFFLVLGACLGLENNATPTNLVWVFVAAVPWALLSTRDRPLDIGLRSLVVVLAALSQPLAALFVPLAVGVWWVRRSRASLVTGIALVVGCAGQALVMASAGGREPSASTTVSMLVKIISTDFVGSFLVGDWHREIWAHLGLWFSGLAVLVTLGVFVVVALGAGRRARATALVLLVYSAVLSVVPLLTNRTPIPLVPGEAAGNAGRYIFLPVGLMVASLAVLLDEPDRRRDRMIAKVGRVVFAIQLVVLAGVGFRIAGPRGVGSQWTPQLRAAEAVCNDPATPPSTTVFLEASPPGWGVTLTCDQLPDP
jgi:hypothetical protein